MEIERVGRLFPRLVKPYVGLCIVALTLESLTAEIIAPARRITWQDNVGVAGGIRIRSTVYTTIASGATAAQINAAIANCPSNQVVKLGPGTFNLSSMVSIKTGVSLRGSGVSNTIITGNSGLGHLISMSQNAGFSIETLTDSRNIVGGATKDSTSLTTSAAHGLQAGDYVLIDQLSNQSGSPPVYSTSSFMGRENGGRPCGQINRVLSVPSSTSLTVELPLYKDYSADTPQLVKLNAFTEWAGCEDLTIDNTSAQCRDGAGTLYLAANCWFHNVEFRKSNKDLIFMYGAYRCTVKKCQVHGKTNVGSNTGYGLWGLHSTANLIEDSVFYDMGLGIVYNGVFSGNAITYCYFHSMGSDNSYIPQCIIAHGGHPQMNLVEGNYVQSVIIGDNYFGSSSHATYLRNRVVNHPNSAYVNDNCRIVLEADQTYYNIVGNVLGTVGYEAVYDRSALDSKGIYNIDNRATTIVHGNWDSVTKTNGGVVWSTNPDHVIASSYYLSAKPTWFGDRPWPPFNPSLPSGGAVTNIPAGYRFVFGVEPPGPGQVTRPEPPVGLRIVGLQ